VDVLDHFGRLALLSVVFMYYFQHYQQNCLSEYLTRIFNATCIGLVEFAGRADLHFADRLLCLNDVDLRAPKS